MQTIFLVLERFNHYSDILRGELIRLLAERYRVVVLTPDLDETAVSAHRYFKHPNIIYQKIAPRYPNLWFISEKYLRKYLVREYDHLAATSYLYYAFPRNIVERLLRGAGLFLPRRLATAAMMTRIESFIARPSEKFDQLLLRYRPALAVTATPGTLWLPLVAETIVFARKRGIPTIAVNSSFDNPYTVPKFVRKTDYHTVWSERMKGETIEFFHYLDERVFVSGCLKFDHYVHDVAQGRVRSREEFLLAKGLDPAKKTILYITPTPGTYKQREVIMSELIALKEKKFFEGDPNIFVRLHPFDVWAPYAAFANIPGLHIERAGRKRASDDSGVQPNVEMDENDLVNLTETVLHTDVMLSFNSTMFLEAALFDKPSVCIYWPERVRQWFNDEVGQALLSSGAERVARTPGELAECVNQYFRNPGLDHDARKRLVADYIQLTDGRAAERTAERIGAIVRGEV